MAVASIVVEASTEDVGGRVVVEVDVVVGGVVAAVSELRQEWIAERAGAGGEVPRRGKDRVVEADAAAGAMRGSSAYADGKPVVAGPGVCRDKRRYREQSGLPDPLGSHSAKPDGAVLALHDGANPSAAGAVAAVDDLPRNPELGAGNHHRALRIGVLDPEVRPRVRGRVRRGGQRQRRSQHAE